MSCPMSLETLLDGWVDRAPTATVTGLALDSRRIQPGDAFVAVEGASAHGLSYLPQAIKRGAQMVIHDGREPLPETNIIQVAVPGLGDRLSSLASRFYHAPSDQLSVVGVTGTNGKTSTAHFIAQAWQRVNRNAGLIGTIGYGRLSKLSPADMTTPDPISLQRMLSDCIDDGVENLAMEVSSHALEQGRCADVSGAPRY